MYLSAENKYTTLLVTSGRGIHTIRRHASTPVGERLEHKYGLMYGELVYTEPVPLGLRRHLASEKRLPELLLDIIEQMAGDLLSEIRGH